MTHTQDTTTANPAQVTDAMVEELRAGGHLSPDGTMCHAPTREVVAALTAAIGAGRSSEPEFETAPDNGTPAEVLAYVLECARRWVPEARIIGNARAGDIERALAAIGAGGQAQGEPVAWQHRLWYADSGCWSEWRDGHRDELLGNKQEERPLYTHPAPSGQAVAVKPLEWYDPGNRIEYADTLLGSYKVNASGSWWLDTGAMEHCGSREAAKAAAQADFERRVLSAIAHPAQPEWQQVGWAYNDKRWDDDRWHVCGMDSKPRSSDGRLIQPIFIAAPQPKGE